MSNHEYGGSARARALELASGAGAREPGAPAPGKQTLVERLPAAGAIQRRAGRAAGAASLPFAGAGGSVQFRMDLFAGGARDEGAVRDAAERGVSTPASALPHADAIQRSFGRHDVSQVQAHTGDAAAASAREMGAEAYAAGDHVVLGEGTDLFTVAHEAAHVVQQRGGVQLKSGIGEVGDRYEQHADEVASLVVQGKSAEAALDRHAGGGGGGGGVQRLPAIQLMRIVSHRGKDEDVVEEVEFRKDELQPDQHGHYNGDGYRYEEIRRTPNTILYERVKDKSSDESSDESDDESDDEDDEVALEIPTGPKRDEDELEEYLEEARDKIRLLLRKRNNTPEDIYGLVYLQTLEKILRDSVEAWYRQPMPEDRREDAISHATSCLGLSIPRGAGLDEHAHSLVRYELHQAAYETVSTPSRLRVPANDVDELIDDREYGNPEDTDEEDYEALEDAIEDNLDADGVQALKDRIELLQKQNSRESMRELQFYTSAFAEAKTKFPIKYAISSVAGQVKAQISSRRAQAIDYEPDEDLDEILDGDLPALPDIGTPIEDVEQDFDVLARKSAPPPKNAIFETDMAMLPTQKGIPIDRASVTMEQGMPTPHIQDDPPQEKVMAIGFQGAIDFEGVLSNGKSIPSRVYGALFPKGLIRKWGVDMRGQDSPNLKKFKQESSGGDQNKLFSIRYEKSTTKNGQVHLHDDWLVEESDGIFHSQIEIMRQRVIGVVEIEQTEEGWVVKNVKDFSGSYGDLF